MISLYTKSELQRLRNQEEALFNQLYEIYDNREKIGLKDREGQENMSLDILSCYIDRKNLLVEAEVGIGKSFAYLIPALLINQLSKKPIIIATSSIQLSEQLMHDIKDISARIKIPVNAVLGKGAPLSIE